MGKKVKFTKMQGAGNDYIYIDATRQPLDNPAIYAIAWSRQHTGIGADGLILIEQSDKADFRMRMFNNDGSEGLMCGNGIRCVGKFVYEKGLTDKKTLLIDTLSGIKQLQLHADATNVVRSVSVDMGEPQCADTSLLATPTGTMVEGEVTTEHKTYRGTFVSMGNPHFVIFVDDLTTVNLAAEGKSIESLPLFPQRCNIEFAQLTPKGIRTRVWERGTGITQACGTGACATLVAAALTGRTTRETDIIMDGGVLSIFWDDASGHVFMTGEAVTVFEGEIEL